MLCKISDKFSWQKIWDLSKKVSAPKKYTVLSTIYEITKIASSRSFIEYLCQFNGLFVKFSEFWCFGKSTRWSARSHKKFLDKKSETCQKSLSFEKSTALSTIYEITKSCNLCHIYSIYTDFMGCFCEFSDFWCFDKSTRCSARSHKKIIDKKSETYQKSLSFEKSTALSTTYEITKSCKLCHI